MSERILGISAHYHDSAACLLEDGEIRAAAQEERFSRKKHDAAFPRQAVAYCLSAAGIRARDLTHVVFYDKPLVKFDRLVATYLHFAPHGLASFLKAMPTWIGEKLWLKDLICTELEADLSVLFTEHHEAHAASAFYPSPFERAAVLTVDGVGEWATATIGLGEGSQLELLQEMRFPHSLGLLYSAFTTFTGFRVNSGEYKLMGLAPYGVPRYRDLILSEIVDLKKDGSLKLNLEHFDFAAGLKMTSDRFARLFGGPPRPPDSPIGAREMDLAASIQAVTEEAMLRMARHAHALTGCDRLALAGGVALNCVANGRILREGPFRELFIQPAAGDAGGALGAALFVHHRLLGGERHADGQRDRQRGSLLGPDHDGEALAGFVAERGLQAERHDDPQRLAERVAGLLAEGKVVGWFQGRMEFGPRALGARSILADPRDPEMQRRLNLKIKFRESFRPFAPVVLAGRAADWFESAAASPYMLLVTYLRQEHRRQASTEARGLERLHEPRSAVPAVTHVDFSARVQTVARDDHPLLHLLIERFGARTGCPMLVNTSFNVRGEPIVCTPQDAYRCFFRTHMDILVLGPFVIDKSRQELPPLDLSAPANAGAGFAESGPLPADAAREARQEAGAARRFALVLATLMALFASISAWRSHPGRAGVFLGIGLGALAALLLAPRAWQSFHALWSRLSRRIAAAVTRLVFAAFYLAILTPFGLVLGWIGRPPLDSSFRDGRASYWLARRKHPATVERYRKLH